ncbi:helix-loop-helix DNA-binding domain-containing protein [Plectosphaerella plurivora]|uniref:Helix-loop-helix DNA-binding domain-containing protein n=1 Tax=Plectosphaerella plurivora TaxID=936078 RepID=A0A9P8VMV1_9PEZI|nr:helix-loop-helix DNA-binding domain-containing protein [Plectosphaerella plurivora]
MSRIAQQHNFDRMRLPTQAALSMSPEVSPLSYYDPQADYSADSAPSRGSPISPVFGNPFQLPLDAEWPAYLDKPEMSPELDVFYGESFGGPMAFMTSQNPTLSPTANPLDLVSDTVVPFGRDDLNDAVPLFQTAGGYQPANNAQQQQSTAHLVQRPASPKMPAAAPRATRSSQRLPTRSDLKRKSSSSDSASSRSTSPEPPARRTRHADPSKNPHNLIEKRYRVNINEKIIALRDAVPALRCVVNQQHGDGEEEAEVLASEELGGLMPARKLNKATILSKATEYIGHLEKKNDQLAKDNLELERKLAEVQRWQRSQVETGGYWA